MTRILFIDDEVINHQLVERALQPLNCELESAINGNEGIAKARAARPDLIITDVMMPDMDGYAVTRVLRREQQFADIPILVLTAQSGLEDKLKAFEAGADEHLSKPFEPAELLARVTAFLRRGEAVRASQAIPAPVEEGRMVALHSLRGGTGCSTLSVNLGAALALLWPGSTILLDLTMTAGQVALMLNMPLRRTWSDIAGFKAAELEQEIFHSIVGIHESGLNFVAAPTLPTESQPFAPETFETALSLAKRHYDYVLADLPHDFSDISIQALDKADVILMIASPDMASIRAVTVARDTYQKLGYPAEKIKLVLNATFPRAGLPKEKIESAMGLKAVATIPYVQELFVEAINYGRPPVVHAPNEPVSGLLEDFAFYLSKDAHKKSKPAKPTEAWKRVYKRFQERKK
jgi:pilus assembly protein CpaE